MSKLNFLSTLALTLLFSSIAHAYIGPGLGTGAIASILGIFFAIIMLLIGVIWYPVKKIIKKLKK